MKLKLLNYVLEIKLYKQEKVTKQVTKNSKEPPYPYEDCKCCGFEIGVKCGDVYEDDRDKPGCGVYFCETCWGHHIGYREDMLMDECRFNYICPYVLQEELQ